MPRGLCFPTPVKSELLCFPKAVFVSSARKIGRQGTKYLWEMPTGGCGVGLTLY